MMPKQPPTAALFWRGTSTRRKSLARKQSFSPPMLSWVSQMVLSILRSLLKNNPKPQVIKEHLKVLDVPGVTPARGGPSTVGCGARQLWTREGRGEAPAQLWLALGFVEKNRFELNTDKTPKGCRPVLVRWLQENQFVKMWVVISMTALPEQTYGLLNWGLKVITVVRKIRMPLS